MTSAFLLAGVATAQISTFHGNIRGSAGAGQVLYASTQGGYFKSSDSGATWAPFYVTEPGLPQPPFAAFAVDPRSESTLYLVTSPAQGGVWKSTDAAASWVRANSGLPATGTIVNTKLVIASTGDLYLRLDTSLYKSTDGSASWTRIATPLPGNVANFDVNFTNPRQMLYASLDTVWKSQDEGSTWQAALRLPTMQDPLTGVSCLASDPLFPNRVYICVSGRLFRVGDASVTGLYRSIDGGATLIPPPPFHSNPVTQPSEIFVDQNGGPLLFLQLSSGGFCKSVDHGQINRCPPPTNLVSDIKPVSGWLDYLERRNANIVWARADSFERGLVMLRSRDAGETWQRVESKARVTLGRPAAPVSLLLASDSTASTTLSAAAMDLPAARIPFTVTASGEPWFSVSAASGTTPASLTVTFRTAGLAPGRRYEGSIRLASPEAANGSVNIPVILEVARPATAAPPAYDVSVVAGNGTTAFPGDGAQATAAGIGDTSGITVDRAGNVYFIGTTHARIRRVTAAGRIETIAGNGANAAAPDGTPALQASLNFPRGLAVDDAGVVYFSEFNAVRRVSGGILGTAVPSSANTFPRHLAFDSQGRLWVAGSTDRISRYVPPSSVVNLPISWPTGFLAPSGIAIDSAGNFFISDSSAHRVYRITPSGQLTVYAGNGSTEGRDSFPAVSTGLASPTALAVDRRGNLFILESGQNRIRMINAAGNLYTVAATQLQSRFQSLAVDADGNLYASASNYIFKLAPKPATEPSLSSRPRNPASLEESVSPGSLFFVEGERFAAQEESAPPEGPWSETLAGATFTVNGRNVPLSSVGPGRLSGQIPYDIEPGAAVAVLSANGVLSREVPFELPPASPGIFTMPGDSSRAADAVVENGEASVLLTGFGPLEPPLVAGVAPAADPPSKAVLGFKVTIGALEGEPIEIIAVPGLPGVGRARFKLPEGLASGSHPVTIRIGEVSSNSALIAVP